MPAGSFAQLGHSFGTISFNFIRTFGYIGFAAGSHAGACCPRSELTGSVYINLIRLHAAEGIVGHQDLIGMAFISLIPIVAVANNAVDMLACVWHFVQSFLLDFVLHLYY